MDRRLNEKKGEDVRRNGAREGEKWRQSNS